MENICINNVWHLKNGHSVGSYLTMLHSFLREEYSDIEILSSGDIVVSGTFILKIYDKYVDRPRTVISLIPGCQNIDELKSLFQKLSAVLPPATVMLTTDEKGLCPFCGNDLKHLVFFVQNDRFPQFFGCCNHSFSFKDSLESFTGDNIMVTPDYILTYEEGTFEAVSHLFPDKANRIFLYHHLSQV